MRFVSREALCNTLLPELESRILLHFGSLRKRLDVDEREFIDALKNPHRHDVEHTKTRGFALSIEHANSLLDINKRLRTAGSLGVGVHFGVLSHIDLKHGTAYIVDTQPRVYEKNKNMMHGIGRLYNGEVPTVSVFDSSILRDEHGAYCNLPVGREIVLVWRGHHRMRAWRDHLSEKNIDLPVVVVGSKNALINAKMAGMVNLRSIIPGGVRKHARWLNDRAERNDS
jgi:hypothetical protein